MMEHTLAYVTHISYTLWLKLNRLKSVSLNILFFNAKKVQRLRALSICKHLMQWAVAAMKGSQGYQQKTVESEFFEENYYVNGNFTPPN
jgi:hypothetical protein